MRIGLVCPYSLTVPGGVQGQVLGLARELRRHGHEARVLGPCDGPPPESFVTPLGNSLPTAANGSVAPIAPDASADAAHDPGAQRRGVRHRPRPRAAGSRSDDDVGADAPGADGRHVPRRRALDELPLRVRSAALGRWTHRPQGRRLQGRHGARPVATSAGSTTSSSTVSRSTSSRPRRRRPTASPTIFFCGRHEERKGLAVLLDAFQSLPDDARLWIASDGPDGARLRAEHGDDKRISWLGRISDRREVRPPARRLGVLRAVAVRRVVRGRADRGDGRRHAGRRQRHRRLPQRRHRRGRRPARRAGRRRRARHGASAPCSTTRLLDRVPPRRRPPRGPRRSR